MLRTSCEGLGLNHPSFVVAVIGNYIPVPKKGNSIPSIGKVDAGFLHRGEDAPPDILGLLREDITEHIPQRFPLRARGSMIAEPVIDLYEGLNEFGRAELLGKFEQCDVVVVDGDIDVVGDRHSIPFLAPFSRETFILLLLPRLME